VAVVTISIDVNPEIEAGLMARADALGVSPEELSPVDR
jgi:hypothetical protein